MKEKILLKALPGTFYDFNVYLGRYFCRAVAKLAVLLFKCIKAPFDLAAFAVSKTVFSIKDFISSAGSVKKGVARYAGLLILPVVAAAVLFAVLFRYGTLGVGLRISSGGVTLGYLRSENEFLEAKNEASQILSLGSGTTGAGELKLPETQYALELINVNKFTASRTMRDALLALASEKTENACGIYINGDFLCAVKNQSDAKAVFDAVLAENQSTDASAMTSFVQHIEYVQGVYPSDPDVLWGRERLSSFVEGLTEANLLGVKELKTEVSSETVKSQTVEIPSDALYIGTSRVLSNGRNGSDQVTKLVTYINGEKTDEEEVYRISVIAPVAQQLQVGTRALDEAFVRGTSYGGILLWPAIGATNINSDYSYRWGRLHAAIDIGSSSGTSLGKTVVAAAEGTVVVAGVHSSYGYYVKIDHGNGMQTLYAHCLAGSLAVKAGDRVSAGTPIAKIGMTGYATGPHLHFEVIINGTRVNPRPYLGI